MKYTILLIFSTAILCTACQSKKSEIMAEKQEKIRTVILTGMTHDDGNSLIRYLFYASHFDLEAMIITNQLPDFNHDDTGPWDKGMAILSAYREELPQLQKHDPNLPGYEELMAVTKQGSGAIPMGESFPNQYFSTCEVDRNELARWIPAATNSFKNRLLWSVKEPGEVNREPVAVVNGDKSNKVVRISSKPGTKVLLDASGSSDPDGDALQFQWYRYNEADSYPGALEIENAEGTTLRLTIPDYLESKNLHIILEVKDDSKPELTTYRRIIIEAEP